MERGGHCWEICFLLLNIFVYWPHVFAQEGYVSLACGRISSFTDSTTGIHWIPDDNYTSTGVAWSTALSSISQSNFNNLRYFPEGNQNCYSLEVTSGTRYLIRSTHVYLNHDGNNRPPEFDVAMDATMVFSVKTSADEPQVHEVILTAQGHYLNYCLLTREGFPVISSLEIRPLPESSYADASHGSLALVSRVDFGNRLHDVRYPHDSLDRIWTKETGAVDGTGIITSRTVRRSRVNNGAAPEIVLKSARIADSRTHRLEYTSSTRNTKDRFIVFLHFAELNSDTKAGDRVFDITANGMPIGEFDVLQSHSLLSEYVVQFSVAGSPTLIVGIEAAETSRELPSVNALEIYQFIPTAESTQDSGGEISSRLLNGYTHNVGYRFLGRRLLIDPSNSTTSESKDEGSDNLWKTFVYAAVGTTGFLILIAILVITYCYRKRRARVPPPSPLFSWTGDASNGPNYVMKSPLQELKQLEMQYTGPQELSLKEVLTVTEKFKSKIGEGGFGAVYYGTLPNGTAVAVKVRSLNSNQGTREFTTELELLRNIRHENLVPLVGFCTENMQQILVYPYMSNGSLYDRLYDKSFGRKPLDWITRLNIILGAARGINFLHNGGDRCIIHRDVKSSNILLDDSMKAKIADFGLSKVSPLDDESIVSTEVRGTAEYLDPEYYQTHQLTEMSDVYSFGIVLLETVCGREPLNMNRPKEERSLLEWVRPYIKDANIQQIVDPEIEAYTPESLWRVLETALQSVEPLSSRRPTIASIVRELEDALIIENNASQYMASIQSLDSLCIPEVDMKDFSRKEPLTFPMTFPFEPSPVFSETMNVAPDPRILICLDTSNGSRARPWG